MSGELTEFALHLVLQDQVFCVAANIEEPADRLPGERRDDAGEFWMARARSYVAATALIDGLMSG